MRRGKKLLNKLDLVRGSKRFDRAARLVKAVDPLRSPGADLQDILLRCDRVAIGELPAM